MSPYVSKWASRYRGATVEDLDPPTALSLTPTTPISTALLASFENDYTHLTILSPQRSLLGYISIPHLQSLLAASKVSPDDQLSAAMTTFERRKGRYTVITMQTPLEELEAFFLGGDEKRDFAVVTDDKRKFVMGVATLEDLERFVERRPE